MLEKQSLAFDWQLAELKEGKRKSIPAFFSDEAMCRKTQLTVVAELT